MPVHLLGTSHRTAGAEARAAFALPPAAVAELLAAARRTSGLELVVLATCGRTEAYLSGDDAVRRFQSLLAEACPAAPSPTEARGWYALEDAGAVEHLLRVACGLDSPLLGDAQLLGQLRSAVHAAQQAGTLGGALSPLFAAALRTGRRARTETAIGEGSPGVGPAAAGAVMSRGASGEVLVLGAGEAARQVLRSLRKAGCTHLRVANRTAAAAADLAGEVGGQWAAWEQVPALLRTCSAVVVATGARSPVLTSLPHRSGPLVVVDAGFPPQVASGLARPGVDVVSLETLTTAAGACSDRRRAAVPDVERIVAAQLEEWCARQSGGLVEQLVRTLHERVEVAATRSAAVLGERADLGPAQVEALIRRELRAALHEPVAALRQLRPRVEQAPA